MNYYELAKEIHANAVAKGFWDKPHSNEHYLMLVITELSEAVEAHRKGRMASIPERIEDFPNKAFVPSFESHIKDTLEDELDNGDHVLSADCDVYNAYIKEENDGTATLTSFYTGEPDPGIKYTGLTMQEAKEIARLHQVYSFCKYFNLDE